MFQITLLYFAIVFFEIFNVSLLSITRWHQSSFLPKQLAYGARLTAAMLDCLCLSVQKHVLAAFECRVALPVNTIMAHGNF